MMVGDVYMMDVADAHLIHGDTEAYDAIKLAIHHPDVARQRYYTKRSIIDSALRYTQQKLRSSLT